MLNYSVVLVSLFDGCKDKAKNLIAQHFSNIFYQKVTFCKQFMIFVNFLIKTSGVMRLVMRRARTLEVSGRCQYCPRPLPTEKAWPFSRSGVAWSPFVAAFFLSSLLMWGKERSFELFGFFFVRNNIAVGLFVRSSSPTWEGKG